jgi:hypothetical protein
MTGNNTMAECSHYQALPTQSLTAFHNHGLVTKERMASPLSFTLELEEFQETEYLIPG